MGQFRTVSDIKTEILQKSGEPVNGNSDYGDLALTYLNKAHQVIIGGGSLFSLKVDEAWTWARARNPMVLELLPPFTTGSVQAVQDDINLTFSNVPADSYEGWYLQVVGKRTIYRITQHDAGLGDFVIDSSFIDATGQYSFRVFKLDYEIFPAYLYIDEKNDRLDFIESGTTKLTASLVHGAYTPNTLIAHVVARLNATGTNGLYSGSYDPVLKFFTLNSTGVGSTIFSLLGPTGTNYRRSALPTLGLDMLDHTGALTYVSAYIVNGISRLIEPFKLFTGQRWNPYENQSQITSTDPDNMEKDYPMFMTPQRIPDRFCKFREENDGTVWVRFNAYPENKTKITIDWVEVPHDLQDNVASFPLLPRKDIDTLIHAATTFIMFDKGDTKWNDMLTATRSQLEAMEKKNRSELFRTGQNFGQITPREDLTRERRRLRYGYTVDQAASNPALVSETVQTMVTRTLSFADFQTAGLQKSVIARQLPANRSLFALIVKHSIPFSGGSISSLLLDVGVAGNPTQFINGFDIMQAVTSAAQDSAIVTFFPAQATDIQVRVTAIGANLSVLTQGSVDLHFNESLVV